MATLSVSTLHYMSFIGYPDLWNGDTADGTASASAALQAAINDCAGVLDLKPGATYLIDSPIYLKPNLEIRGNGAVLKRGATPGAILAYDINDLANVRLTGIRFDGSLTWPSDLTIDKNEITATYAIYINSDNAQNIEISYCSFHEISGGSIALYAIGGRNISVHHNDLLRGNFQGKGIAVFCASGSGEEEETLCMGVDVSFNRITEGGPTAFVDASVEGYVNSADGIHVDTCGNFTVICNSVDRIAAIGIRIERSRGGVVKGNNITSPGFDGIVAYLHTKNVSFVGNFVKDWGRIPHAYALLDYSGTLVYAKETPNVSEAPFPADPTASDWWGTWPYVTTGVDLESVIDYDDKEYYSGYSEGVLPFRGRSGISVIFLSSNIAVSGNICIPNTEMESGKYTHASDYGFSSVHPVNNPTDTPELPIGVISGNIFGGRLAGIYTPEYMDPINERGELGDVAIGTNAEP